MNTLRLYRLLVIPALLLSLFLLLSCSEEGTGDVVTDKDPPTVTGHMPLDGAQSVSRSGPFWISFSEAMDEESVSDGLSMNPHPGFGTHWEQDTICLTLHTLLAGNTQYNITVDGSSEDMAGNELGNDYTISFTTTADADNDPPGITRTSPTDGAEGVNPSAVIEITFDETVSFDSDWESQTDIEITPYPSDGFFELEGLTLKIAHMPFPTDSLITVTVTTGVTDLAGNPLETAHTFSFRTYVDNTRPQLVSATPSNGATGVSTTLGQMVFNFSESMFYYIEMPYDNVDARIQKVLEHEEPYWNEDMTSMTVDINGDLAPGCNYWVDFTGFMDEAGNMIEPDPTHYEFTTSGALSYFPLENGMEWEYLNTEEGTERRTISDYNPHSGNFDIIIRENDGGGEEIAEVWHMRITSTQVLHLGRDDYQDGSYEDTWTWDDPLLYLKLPIQNHMGEIWDFSTTFTVGTESATLDGRIVIALNDTSITNEELWGTFKDCISHNMQITIDAGGPHEMSMTDRSWYAPGVGCIMEVDVDSESGIDSMTVTNWNF